MFIVLLGVKSKSIKERTVKMHNAPKEFSSTKPTQTHTHVYIYAYVHMHACAHIHIQRRFLALYRLLKNPGFKRQLNIDIFTSQYFLFKSKQLQQETLQALI